MIGTTEGVPGPGRPGGRGRRGGRRWAWELRFFDPVVLPALGLVAEAGGPAPDEVRRVLGVGTYLYHLVVEPGSQLTPHHATHAGTGLASAHAAATRELETIRAHAPCRQDPVDELGATTAGLVRAQSLLARELASATWAWPPPPTPPPSAPPCSRPWGQPNTPSRPGRLPPEWGPRYRRARGEPRPAAAPGRVHASSVQNAARSRSSGRPRGRWG